MLPTRSAAVVALLLALAWRGAAFSSKPGNEPETDPGPEPEPELSAECFTIPPGVEAPDVEADLKACEWWADKPGPAEECPDHVAMCNAIRANAAAQKEACDQSPARARALQSATSYPDVLCKTCEEHFTEQKYKDRFCVLPDVPQICQKSCGVGPVDGAVTIEQCAAIIAMKDWLDKNDFAPFPDSMCQIVGVPLGWSCASATTSGRRLERVPDETLAQRKGLVAAGEVAALEDAPPEILSAFVAHPHIKDKVPEGVTTCHEAQAVGLCPVVKEVCAKTCHELGELQHATSRRELGKCPM